MIFNQEKSSDPSLAHVKNVNKKYLTMSLTMGLTVS